MSADTLETAQAPLAPPPSQPGQPAKAPLPLWRTFLVFLAPMMLSNILQSLSGTINNVFLGQMLGVEALAAATVFFPIIFFFMAFVIGLGAGASVMIGQAFGKGDMERVRAVAGAALTLALMFGATIAVLGGLFAPQLMVALQTPPDILKDATGYARIMMISMPAFFIFLLYTSILRGVGDTVTPLWTLIVSTTIGLIVTPAFVAGWFGLPKLGVASAAVASLVSLVVALGWMAFHLRRLKHALAPNAALFRHFRLDPKILGTVFRIGVPTGFQMVIMALAEIVLLGLANSYGSDATAAYGAINQVLAYVQFPAMSIGIASSILGAQAIGAGRMHQLWEITRTGLMLNVFITGAGVIIVYLFSHSIIAAFITDPAVIELTNHLLQIVLWSSVVFGFAVVFSGIMRSSGTVLAPTAIGIFAIIAVEVPVAWFLSHAIGVDGVWIGYPASFTAMFILQGAYYGLVWRKRTIRALV